jgi:hypothetical protein
VGGLRANAQLVELPTEQRQRDSKSRRDKS